MKKLLLLMLIPYSVFAGEVDTACQLYKAKADSQAEILIMPQLFVSAGSSNNTQQTISAGITESISNYRKGTYLQEAAEANCDAIKATTLLDKHGKFGFQNVLNMGAKAELTSLDNALSITDDTISVMQDKLKSKIITVTQYEEVKTLRDMITDRQTVLLGVLSKSVIKEDENLTDTYIQARDASARAASLEAKANATSGWDITVSAGGVQPIGNIMPGTQLGTQGVLSVTAKYSFGEYSSRKAADQVEILSKQLMDEQTIGYNIALQQEKIELQGLIIAERIHLKEANKSLQEVENLLESLKGIESDIAENIKDVHYIKMMIMMADIEGSKIRLDEYQNTLIRIK
jgi:hypothetical protein